MLFDPKIQARKDYLVAEVQTTLKAIRGLAHPDISDPFTDPTTLGQAVRKGILDAPHLKNNKIAKGTIKSGIINGACETINKNNKPVSEIERLAEFLN